MARVNTSLTIKGNVGAGSVVTKDVVEGTVVRGNPAKDPEYEIWKQKRLIPEKKT